MKSFKEIYSTSENKIAGIGAAPGIIIGEAYLFTKEKLQISKADIVDVEKAKSDLEEAIAKSKKSLIKYLPSPVKKWMMFVLQYLKLNL